MDYATLLALLGEGSAHPGGFRATKELIDRIKLSPGAKVPGGIVITAWK